MSKPLEIERISQIEMRMYRKAIPLSRSAISAANMNPIRIHNQGYRPLSICCPSKTMPRKGITTKLTYYLLDAK